MRDWLKLSLSRVTFALAAIVALIAVTGTVVAISALHDAHEASHEAVEASQVAQELATEVRATAVHTREVQKSGEPVGVCLRLALEQVTPLLERVPTVRHPLEAYTRLQRKRYKGVRCPDRREP
jgi:hypothetical protein